MKKNTSKAHAFPRENGVATKARIIEAAGRLFAEQGYAETTSRQICAAARTNITGVNYHFGSRDGLYEVVLKTVHDYIINIDFLVDLAGSDLPPREKLERFIDAVTDFDDGAWQLRLWAREVVAPSDLWQTIVAEGTFKADLLLGMLADHTGVPAGDPLLNYFLMCLMSPIMVMLVANNRERTTEFPCIPVAPENLAEYTKSFFFAGVEALRLRVAAEAGAAAMRSTA